MAKIKIDRNKVLELNEKGYNTVQIANELNCNNSSIGRILKENGIKAKCNKYVLSDTKEKMICEMYKQGFTAKEVGEQFGYTDGGIRKILIKNGVELRKAIRRSTIENHNYFSVIDNEEKAYFLGLLIADGCIVYPNRAGRAPVISLELNKEDGYLIEKFKEVLNGTMKIVTHGNCLKISFSSEQMANDLAQYGIIPQKSDKTFVPKLNEYLMPHLIRGIFDGDGTVYIYYDSKEHLRFGFYGTNTLCNQIRDYYHFEPAVFDKEGVSFIIMQKKSDVEKFYNHIYTDATIYMRRKKNKFDNYLC